MTDTVTNELLLEQLKAIQAKLSQMANDLADLKTDMRGINAGAMGEIRALRAEYDDHRKKTTS